MSIIKSLAYKICKAFEGSEILKVSEALADSVSHEGNCKIFIFIDKSEITWDSEEKTFKLNGFRLTAKA